jgi:predicted RNA-binding Zn-ribbon protein involved in translation (DUF1610 family)
MKWVLYLLGIVALIASVSIFSVAKGAIHEIEAMVGLLIGAVCIVGGAILGGIEGAIERVMAGFLGPSIVATCRVCRSDIRAFMRQVDALCPGCGRRFVVKDGKLEEATVESPP